MSDDIPDVTPPGRQQQWPKRERVWGDLARFTVARIGLGRTGASLATEPLLDLKLAHARARDAVNEPLDELRLITDLSRLGVSVASVSSAATSRQDYLLRPDLGRRLDPRAAAALGPYAGEYDIVFVITDGLSARAVQAHASALLAGVLPGLHEEGWRIAPLVIVRHGRVGVGDVVAGVLHAACVAVLIGERPGLSAPDSMGVYLTWQPHLTTTDADRNCISNVRPEGIGYVDAAFKLAHMLRAIRACRLSGVQLKDGSDRSLLAPNEPR